jgi:hypothetical protein
MFLAVPAKSCLPYSCSCHHVQRRRRAYKACRLRPFLCRVVITTRPEGVRTILVFFPGRGTGKFPRRFSTGAHRFESACAVSSMLMCAMRGAMLSTTGLRRLKMPGIGATDFTVHPCIYSVYACRPSRFRSQAASPCSGPKPPPMCTATTPAQFATDMNGWLSPVRMEGGRAMAYVSPELLPVT